MTGRPPGQLPEPPFVIARLPRPDELAALAAFRAAHPGARIGGGRFFAWEAVIPEPDGVRYTARDSLGELLGRLGELYGPW